MWDDARIHEATETLDVVRVPFAVHTAVLAALEVEDGGLNVGLFADAYFAFAVEVPDGFREGFGDVGTFFL